MDLGLRAGVRFAPELLSAVAGDLVSLPFFFVIPA
jgi:hypothetical protein